MPRDHARMQTALWRPGSDFRTLPWDAQWAYQMLCQQDALSYAGVIDHRPGRWTVLADGLTLRQVEKAVRRLEAKRYVLIDQVTEELLVRTYVRHDGVMDRTNMGKAVGRALARVASPRLHDTVVNELARLYGAKPDKPGFGGLAELYPEVMDRVTALASTIPFPIASGEA